LHALMYNEGMKTNAYTNFRIRKETQHKLKVIAALKRESMLDTLDRLVSTEYERVQKEGDKYAGHKKDQD
jgi:hypothetical protein